MILIYLESDIPCFCITNEQAERFRNLLPKNADFPLIVCRTETDFLAHLKNASSVFVWSFKQEWFSLAPNLKHVCTPAAGKDYFKVSPPKDVTMHYGSFHGTIMGETALGALLATSHGLLPYASSMNTSPWPRIEIARSSKQLSLSTILILGFGNIGKKFAEYLHPFHPKIIAITESEHPEYKDLYPTISHATIREIDNYLPLADHIVAFLPSGEKTTHIMNAQKLALLKPSSFLYNFGRGNLIDEEALFHALNEKKLAGAVLDVFEKEPLETTSKLRSLPNCFLYPHSSAFSPNYLDLYFSKVATCMAQCAD